MVVPDDGFRKTNNSAGRAAEAAEASFPVLILLLNAEDWGRGYVGTNVPLGIHDCGRTLSPKRRGLGGGKSRRARCGDCGRRRKGGGVEVPVLLLLLWEMAEGIKSGEVGR